MAASAVGLCRPLPKLIAGRARGRVSRRTATGTYVNAHRGRPMPVHRTCAAVVPARRGAVRGCLGWLDASPVAPLRDHPSRRGRSQPAAVDGQEPPQLAALGAALRASRPRCRREADRRARPRPAATVSRIPDAEILRFAPGPASGRRSITGASRASCRWTSSRCASSLTITIGGGSPVGAPTRRGWVRAAVRHGALPRTVPRGSGAGSHRRRRMDRAGDRRAGQHRSRRLRALGVAVGSPGGDPRRVRLSAVRGARD